MKMLSSECCLVLAISSVLGGGCTHRQRTADANAVPTYVFTNSAASAQTPAVTPSGFGTNSQPTILGSHIVWSNGMHNAYPTVAYDALRKRLLAAWTMGTWHTQTSGVGLMAESWDAGKSWGNVREVVNDTNAGFGSISLSVSVLRDGTICLVNRRVHGLFRNYLLLSRDGGKTFQTNWTPTLEGSPYASVFDAPLTETSRGTWLLPGYYGGKNSGASLLRTTNHGAAWEQIALDTKGNEFEVREHPSGRLYALVRRMDAPAFVEYFSENDGVTWSGPFTNNIVGGFTPAFPHFVFCGQRMYWSGRDVFPGTFLKLGWADDYPYYTNLTHSLILRRKPSLYCSGVCLNEDLSLWVGSTAEDRSESYFSTNAAIHCFLLGPQGSGEPGKSGNSQ